LIDVNDSRVTGRNLHFLLILRKLLITKKTVLRRKATFGIFSEKPFCVN